MAEKLIVAVKLARTKESDATFRPEDMPHTERRTTRRTPVSAAPVRRVVQRQDDWWQEWWC